VESECEVANIAKLYNCGVMCPPGDPHAIALSILQLYEDSGSLKRMGENAGEAAKNFDKKAALNSFYNLFSKWAESSKG
jgi:glycosyltransferase involved in cell wall biosynthesis